MIVFSISQKQIITESAISHSELASYEEAAGNLYDNRIISLCTEAHESIPIPCDIWAEFLMNAF